MYQIYQFTDTAVPIFANILIPMWVSANVERKCLEKKDLLEYAICMEHAAEINRNRTRNINKHANEIISEWD